MKRVLGLLVAAAMAAVVWWWWPSESTARSEALLRYQLEPGLALRYAVDYRAREQVAPPGMEGQLLDVETQVRGQVDVRVLEQRDDHWLMSWRFTAVDSLHLGLGGATAADDASAESLLLARPVYYELAFDGTVREVYLDPEDPEPLRTIAKLLIAETQLPLPDGAETSSWRAVVDAGLGAARTQLEVSDRTGLEVEIEAQRIDYARLLAVPWREDVAAGQRLEHAGHYRFAGWVTRAHHEQHLELRDGDAPVMNADTSLEWTLLAARREAPPRETDALVAAREAYRLDQVPPSPDAERSLLQSQVGELNWPVLEARLRGFDASMLHDEAHAQLMWQAMGLLTLDPQLCRAMLPVFEDAAVGDDARALMLDLLTAVGHDTAQSTMRQMLVSDRAAADDVTHARMVQRLSRVEQPGDDTARFVLERYDAAPREHEHKALALSVGSVLRKLPEDSSLKQELYERLVGDLDRAEDPAEQAALLRGLSNAGQPDNVAIAAAYADAESAGVRAAAAISLAKVQGPEAEAVLADLAGDGDLRVQGTALHALDRRELHEDTRVALAEQIAERQIDPRSYWAAYDLVRDFPPGEREAVAEQMYATAPDDPRLRGKLDALREGGR